MRTHKTLDLDPGRAVTVRELRVRDVRQILAALTPEQAKRPLPELIREHLPDLLALLGDSLTLPDGEVLDDLSLSECETLGRAWWELHQRFFAPLLALARAHGTPPATSTAPVSSSSNAAMAPSTTTAGVSG
ncbi:hypothetical protein [Thiocystis violascens]|uniref:Uncharacterized protein n=1 Tax=Thiocystis violascens (strain ATCC 17096 / DSM 198 / 6111) TaxID=765911 RepID=I3YGX2_THIV6|nr:hypothetical protein [Thiocystis violascens]AFL76240.1 hypothetical protein Thivi_4438 [Thiocystis violascens DSM 198]